MNDAWLWRCAPEIRTVQIDIGASAPVTVEPIGWASVRRGDFATAENVTWVLTSVLELCDFVQMTYEVVRSPSAPCWRGRKGYLQHSEYGNGPMRYWRMTNVTHPDCQSVSDR